MPARIMWVRDRIESMKRSLRIWGSLMRSCWGMSALRSETAIIRRWQSLLKPTRSYREKMRGWEGNSSNIGNKKKGSREGMRSRPWERYLRGKAHERDPKEHRVQIINNSEFRGNVSRPQLATEQNRHQSRNFKYSRHNEVLLMT